MMNLLYKLLLIGLVAFGVFTMWIDKNTPSIAQIKTEMYKEQIAKLNDAEQRKALAISDIRESTTKAQKAKNGILTCFDTENDKRFLLDNPEGFKFASKDECMTSGSYCMIKGSLTCTDNS